MSYLLKLEVSEPVMRVYSFVRGTEISAPKERKAFLERKRLCFNCAAGQHNPKKCPSKLLCHTCRRRHDTSLCQQASEPSLTTNIAGTSVIYPVVIVDVNGRKFRTLLDSGASQSYVSSTLIDLIGARVVGSGTCRVATLLGVTTTKLQEHDLCLCTVKGDFALNTRVTRIDKRELLMLDNPQYAERIANHLSDWS